MCLSKIDKEMIGDQDFEPLPLGRLNLLPYLDNPWWWSSSDCYVGIPIQTLYPKYDSQINCDNIGTLTNRYWWIVKDWWRTFTNSYLTSIVSGGPSDSHGFGTRLVVTYTWNIILFSCWGSTTPNGIQMVPWTATGMLHLFGNLSIHTEWCWWCCDTIPAAGRLPFQYETLPKIGDQLVQSFFHEQFHTHFFIPENKALWSLAIPRQKTSERMKNLSTTWIAWYPCPAN